MSRRQGRWRERLQPEVAPSSQLPMRLSCGERVDTCHPVVPCGKRWPSLTRRSKNDRRWSKMIQDDWCSMMLNHLKMIDVYWCSMMRKNMISHHQTSLSTSPWLAVINKHWPLTVEHWPSTVVDVVVVVVVPPTGTMLVMVRVIFQRQMARRIAGGSVVFPIQ